MVCLLEYTNTVNLRHRKLHGSKRDAMSLPFSSESALVEDFLTLANFKGGKDVAVTAELDAGNGIADIVILKRRRSLDDVTFFEEIPPQWAFALYSLPYRRVFNTQQFADIACVSIKTAEKILRGSSAAGIVRTGELSWMKNKQPRPAFSQVFAIEAKIRDWRRALFQATRYQEFAHQSWVLLDGHYARPAAENIQEFVRRNIGLIMLSNDGHLITAYQPKPSIPRSQYRHWYAMVAAYQAMR